MESEYGFQRKVIHMQQNKVAVNLAQDFTDEQKAQGRQNIGAGTSNSTIVHDTNTLPPVTTNVNQMTIFNDGRTKFDNKYNGVIPSEPSQSDVGSVLVANYAGSPAKGTAQWKNVHNIGINEVPTGGSDGQVLTWNNNTYAWATSALKITNYDASFGNSWNSMRKMDSSISSGVTIKEATLSSSISLSAGKKYLITPIGIIGNVEQTKTVSVTRDVAYSLRIWLCDSTKSMLNNSTAVIIGEAEIANHYVAALGEYPLVNGVYRGSFAPTDAIITPTQNLSLDTLRICNGGNIDFGFNSSNPALLVFDTRITGINVMEIQ